MGSKRIAVVPLSTTLLEALRELRSPNAGPVPHHLVDELQAARLATRLRGVPSLTASGRRALVRGSFKLWRGSA